MPIVTTCCSGAYELLGKQNEFGIVVPNSEDGLFQGLSQMLSDSELMQHYRQTAESRGKNFSSKESTGAVEKLFSELFNM